MKVPSEWLTTKTRDDISYNTLLQDLYWDLIAYCHRNRIPLYADGTHTQRFSQLVRSIYTYTRH
jgi:hypothetical protein